MATREPPRILCVDDEPHVLASLSRVLRRDFDVVTAERGAIGLEILRDQGPFAVVLSDMRMPEMDGATFLAAVHRVVPDTVRVLLTGDADLQAAISAINHGRIFRFLQKPCPPDLLRETLASAVEQYRLRTAERVLLQQTLRGSIQMLTDVLSLANPSAFGRATRIKKCVSSLADRLGIADKWPIEVAAMLSQIGCITLPPDTVEKLHRGEELDPDEGRMVGRLTSVPVQLLENIPRMEPVREILKHQDTRFDGSGPPRDGLRRRKIPVGARLLKVALDFDTLESRGMEAGPALGVLRGRRGWYDPDVLDALAVVKQSEEAPFEIRELPLADLRPGMSFAGDVKTTDGLLLVARGQEVTTSLLQRLQNFAANRGLEEPLRVVVPLPRGAKPRSAAAPAGGPRL